MCRPRSGPRLWNARPVAAAVVTAAAAVLLASCSNGGNAASGTTSTTGTKTSAAATRSTVPPPSTTTPPPTRFAVASCTSTQLSVALGAWGGESNDDGGLIIFTNTSSSTCALMGYPTVVATATGGQALMTAKQSPNGMLGGVTGVPAPQVVIRAGLAGSAVIEGGSVPREGTSCVTIATLVITPPGVTSSFSVPNAFHTGKGVPGCTPISVHPVLPGFHYRDTPTGLTPTGL